MYGDKAKRELTAIDQGGPSRQFLAECWKQLGGLRINVGAKQVRLFEISPCGPIPLTDDVLRHKIEATIKSESGSKEADKSEIDGLVEVARCYYLAIGRLMLHSVATNVTIASSAMIPFYQNRKYSAIRSKIVYTVSH